MNRALRDTRGQLILNRALRDSRGQLILAFRTGWRSFPGVSLASEGLRTKRQEMMMKTSIPRDFRAIVAHEDGRGSIIPSAARWAEQNLSPGIELQILYSSLNYKDALSATGHRGISPHYPHIPGIDAYARRLDSGEEVLVTGFDFGMGTPGGFAQYARVPEEWLIPLPQGLSGLEAMSLGTAGVTAALGLEALVSNGIEPGHGPILVTGATGGVGSTAIGILSKLAYEVHAVTGKPEKKGWLMKRGASRIISREDFLDQSRKALLPAEYAGAIDSLAGPYLHRILRSLKFGGVLALCGMIAGNELPGHVYPFILRGVKLIGLASADCPRETKKRMWEALAGPWRPKTPPATLLGFEQIPSAIDRMLKGEQTGRVVLDCFAD